jgi:hypothetical protein
MMQALAPDAPPRARTESSRPDPTDVVLRARVCLGALRQDHFQLRLLARLVRTRGGPVKLDQPSLLGSRPWGVFAIVATGPMGQALRARLVTLPSIRLSHDWAEWRQGDKVQRSSLRTLNSWAPTFIGRTPEPGRYQSATVGRRFECSSPDTVSNVGRSHSTCVCRCPPGPCSTKVRRPIS